MITELAPSAVEQIARRVVELLGQSAPGRDVLNLGEAIAYVGKAECAAPEKAFARWRKKHGVRPCGRARYSRRSLNAALEREGRR